MPRYSKKQKAMLEEMMKDDIFEAARKIVVQDGIDGLTMERIAKEIGVSRSTLYNYFADWHDLMSFVEDRIISPIVDEAQAILGGPEDLLEQLHRVGETFFRRLSKHRELTFALFDIKNSRSGSHKKYEFEKRQGFIVDLIDHFKKGMEQGVYKKTSAEIMAQIYFGAITSIFETALIRGELADPEVVVPILNDLISTGICKPKN